MELIAQPRSKERIVVVYRGSDEIMRRPMLSSDLKHAVSVVRADLAQYLGEKVETRTLDFLGVDAEADCKWLGRVRERVRGKTWVDRFRSKIQKCRGSHDIWMGAYSQPSTSVSPIPKVSLPGGKKVICARRAAYIAFCAPLPDGIHVIGNCGNHRCVFPRHAYLQPRKLRVDVSEWEPLSRPSIGENHPRSRLTEPQVLAIYNGYHKQGRTQWSLAVEHDVSESTIGKITRGETWTHVTGHGEPTGNAFWEENC